MAFIATLSCRGTSLRGTFRCFIFAYGLLLSQAVHAQTNDSPKCSFRGEIFNAENFDGILVYRGNESASPIKARRNLALYPGDHLTIATGQKVQVRDRPGQSVRTLTASDSPFKIAEPDGCTASPGFLAMFDIIRPFIDALSTGPVAAEPLATLPRGDSPSKPLAFAFQGEQKIVATSKGVEVRWNRLKAKVTLKRMSDGSIANIDAGGRPYTYIAMPSNMKQGERLVMQISSGRLVDTMNIVVVSENSLPMPKMVSTDDMTSEEKVIYALWLALSGPIEWRLQGYSLVALEAKTNYMAWKTWRAINAQEVER